MINKVILVGNVGRDPEVRYLDSGVAVAKFPLATSETYTNKSGDKVTNTEWHNVVIWRKLAEVVEKYVKKGQQLYLEGKISSRSYEDKDGIKKYITEIVVDNLQMLGKKSDNNEQDNAGLPAEERAGNKNTGNSGLGTADGTGNSGLGTAAGTGSTAADTGNTAAGIGNTAAGAGAPEAGNSGTVTPPASGEAEEEDDLPF